MPDFTIGEGDASPSISRTLVGDDELPINLSGATVLFRMGLPNVDGFKISAPAVVVSAADGTARYDWDGTDTDTPGIYEADFLVTLPSGKPVTVPNDPKLSVLVRKAVG